MENVLIDEIWDTSVIFFGPASDATSLLLGLTSMSIIKVEIEEPTDSKGPFKLNKEAYDALTTKYFPLPDESEAEE